MQCTAANAPLSKENRPHPTRPFRLFGKGLTGSRPVWDEKPAPRTFTPSTGETHAGNRRADLAVLDRPGRHLHRYRRPEAGRHARHLQAPLRKPGTLPGRGRARHPHPARSRPGCAHPGGLHRRGQDGHHRGHQRTARTNRRAHPPGHHPRLRRRPAHRLPEPAGAVRPPHRPARAAARAGDRGGRAGGRGRPGAGAARPGPGRRGPARRLCRRAARGGHRPCARLPLSGARTAAGRDRPDHRLHPGLDQPPGEPAHQAGGPRRHHRGRRLPEPHPAPLRGPGGRPDRRRRPRPAPVVHAVQRRPHRRGPVPRSRRGALRPGRRGDRHGPHRGHERPHPADRL